MMKFSTGLAVAAMISAAMLTGCAEKPKTAETAPPPASASGPSQVTQSSITAGSAEDFRVNVGDTVHFAYNSSALDEQSKSVLQRQATWMQKYPAVTVQVQGNCDERGTREYNIALGARRASAAKDFLVSLGVSPARVDTISYGKERPVCSESTDSCWAENRRDVTAIARGASS